MIDNHEPAEQYQDVQATLALCKTLVFIFYSLPVFFLVLGVFEIFVEEKLESPLFSVSFFLLELPLLWLIVRGILPGSAREVEFPFSERQLGLGIQVLSMFAWAFHADPEVFIVWQWLINGTLVLGVAVFFIVKSILSSRLRLEILLAILLPLYSLYYTQNQMAP